MWVRQFCPGPLDKDLETLKPAEGDPSTSSSPVTGYWQSPGGTRALTWQRGTRHIIPSLHPMSVTLPGTPPCSRKPKAPLPEKKGDSLFINSAGGKVRPAARPKPAPLIMTRAFHPHAHTRKVYCCISAFLQSPLPFMQGEGC